MNIRRFLTLLITLVLILTSIQTKAVATDAFISQYEFEQTSIFTENSKSIYFAARCLLPRAWTDHDRRQVEEAMQTIERAFPRIISLASRDHPIEFCRVKECSNKDANAECYLHSIGLSDAYFALPFSKRVGVLMHELTHAIDVSCHISHGQEWCKIVCPRIKAFKSRWTGAYRSIKSRNALQQANQIAAECKLPRSYAAVDPAEALACAVESAYHYQLKDPEIIRFLNAHILLMNEDSERTCETETRAGSLLFEAAFHLEVSDFDEALQYTSVLLSDKGEPVAGAYKLLGDQFLAQGQRSMARFAYNQYLKKLQELEIPPSCRSYREVVRVLKLCENQSQNP